MKTYPNPVSFRLDETYSERLHKAAQKYRMSSGEYARRLVLDGLEDAAGQDLRSQVGHLERQTSALQGQVTALHGELSQLGSELSALRGELVALRGELRVAHFETCLSTEAIMVVITEQVTTEDAKAWVTENLTGRRGPDPRSP